MARPSVITPKVIKKLEQAFRDGAHIYEACEVAGISARAYYDNLKVNEEFSHKMSLAQEYITEIARGVVSRSIKKGRTEDARWWLERKKKDEFSTRTEQTGKDGKDLPQPVFQVMTIAAKDQLEQLYAGSDSPDN